MAIMQGRKDPWSDMMEAQSFNPVAFTFEFGQHFIHPNEEENITHTLSKALLLTEFSKIKA